MADHTLHGNCERCTACALRREGLDLAPFDRASVPCNNCGGTGLVAISEAEIVRIAVEHARLHYWPAFEARWGIQQRERPGLTPGLRDSGSCFFSQQLSWPW